MNHPSLVRDGWFIRPRSSKTIHMLTTFRTPPGIQILDNIKDFFIKGRVYLRSDKFILFVCGGPLEAPKTAGVGTQYDCPIVPPQLCPLKTPKESHRKRFIDWAKGELKDFYCLLAEDALNSNFVGEDREFVNLSQFESIVASVSDGVLIFPESPGSYAEIGFFSRSEISKKTLVANLLDYQTDNSFLNLGPIHSISSAETFLQPVFLTESNGAINFDPIRKRLQNEFPLTTERQRLSYKEFKNLKIKERLCVTFEMVRLLQPVDLGTIRHAIAHCFKANPSNADIKHLLCSAPL